VSAYKTSCPLTKQTVYLSNTPSAKTFTDWPAIRFGYHRQVCDSLPRGNLTRGNLSYLLNKNNWLELTHLNSVSFPKVLRAHAANLLLAAFFCLPKSHSLNGLINHPPNNKQLTP